MKTKPHFTEIVNTLEASRTQFYTHGTSDQVPVKIVLSGLPVFPVEEVTQELAAVNVRPASVRQLATSKHGDYALYLLQFSNGAVKLQDLQKVTSLFNVIVWWRYYSKRRPTSCSVFGVSNTDTGCEIAIWRQNASSVANVTKRRNALFQEGALPLSARTAR